MHAEKKTCPKDLRYKARVNIAPDEDLKSDISHIRRDAEEKLIGTLTRYHYRRAESNRIKLKKEQQKLNISREKKTNNPGLIKNRPGKDRANRTDNVIALATELTNKIKKVEELMKSLKNKKSESVGWKFIPTPTVKENTVRQQLLLDFKQFARRMCL